MELAKAVADTWQQREVLDRQLAEYGPNDATAAELLVKLDGFDAKLKERRRRRRILFKRRRKLAKEAKAIAVNDLLCQQAAKLDAVGEQQAWMASLAGQIKKLEDEVAELELASESAQPLWLTAKNQSPPNSAAQTAKQAIARPAGQSVSPPQISERQVSDLRIAAKALTEAGRRYSALKGDLGLSGEHGVVEGADSCRIGASC